MNIDGIEIMAVVSIVFIALGFALLLVSLQDVFSTIFQKISSGIESSMNMKYVSQDVSIRDLKTTCNEQLEKIKSDGLKFEQAQKMYIDNIKKARTHYEEQANIDRFNVINQFEQTVDHGYHPESMDYKLATNMVFDNLSDLMKESNNEALVEKSLAEFNIMILNYETKSALPYLVLLNILNMYTDEELVKFKDAFTYFFGYWSTGDARRVLRNRFLSPEEKLKVIDEETHVNKIDVNFNEFLLYMLTKHSYKEFKVIYENFLKSYEVRYREWEVEFIVSKEELIPLLEEALKEEKRAIKPKFTVEPSLIGGLQLWLDGSVIDYSYRRIINKKFENEGDINGRN